MCTTWKIGYIKSNDDFHVHLKYLFYGKIRYVSKVQQDAR